MSARTDENLNVLNNATPVPSSGSSVPLMPSPRRVSTPIIVSLGKKKKKTIKRLKRGKGPAIDEINDVIAQVQANLGDHADGKLIVPVVVLYKVKQRGPRRPF